MESSELETRFTYHQPSPMQGAVYSEIRAKAKAFAEFLNIVLPESREKAVAFTDLESSVMWANVAIARRS